MSLTLTVDERRWTAHLRDVVARHPGIVPVAKGNGYGFGIPFLARRAAALGVDTLAVGTYDELVAAREHFPGDVLVLYPSAGSVAREDRVLHTVRRPSELPRAGEGGRVVVEGLTSMRRHGMPPGLLTEARRSGATFAGLSLHPSPEGDRVAEVRAWLERRLAPRVYVSSLSDTELAGLAAEFPGVELRPRIGTALWLGDRSALAVTATVLDVHPIARGDHAGYSQRRAPRGGHLVVVAGGTAHGIGLRTPFMGRSARHRAASLAKGLLDAGGLVLSPYRIAGHRRWFYETPHMQTSLVFLPASVPPPTAGEAVPAEVRFTTTTFDRVVAGES